MAISIKLRKIPRQRTFLSVSVTIKFLEMWFRRLWFEIFHVTEIWTKKNHHHQANLRPNPTMEIVSCPIFNLTNKTLSNLNFCLQKIFCPRNDELLNPEKVDSTKKLL